jgi:hypothetical protein
VEVPPTDELRAARAGFWKFLALALILFALAAGAFAWAYSTYEAQQEVPDAFLAAAYASPFMVPLAVFGIVSLIASLRAGAEWAWRARAAGVAVPAPARLALRLRGRKGAPRCPYCHDQLDDLLGTHRCPGCATLLHPECSREAGGCPTLGCLHRPPPSPSKQVET